MPLIEGNSATILGTRLRPLKETNQHLLYQQSKRRIEEGVAHMSRC